jgi:hypothetical protein
MDFTSQICTTKEQSDRLLALGLKKETADCVMMYYDGWHIGEAEHFDFDKDPVEPAWSLHRLLCLLPKEYTYDTDFQQIIRDFVFGSKDMYDEVISCIETLIEAGYFYEEYLEEHLCGKR